MKIEHTKGKWIVQSYRDAENIKQFDIKAEDGSSIASVYPLTLSAKSNATLIAAAPELFEALDGLTKYFAFMVKDPQFHEYTKAVKAINKAKGL